MSMLMSIGKRGENAARSYLLKRGFVFIEANWRYKHKEIDLIFKDKNNLIVFIEVKTRRALKENNIPFYAKQNKNIKEAALNYCLKNKIKLENVRFDLIIILYKNNQASLCHYLDICR